MLKNRSGRALVVGAGLVVLAAAGAALACGEWFPNHMLVGGDGAVLAAPVGDFMLEMKRLKPAGKPEFTAVIPDRPTDELRQSFTEEQRELEAALVVRGAGRDVIGRVLAGQRAVREAINNHMKVKESWKERTWDKNRGEAPRLSAPALPEGMPIEFSLYLKGLEYFHDGEMDDARGMFKEVLLLPEGQRVYRPVWAAYMVGRSYVEENPEKAVEWFAKVREMSKKGGRDPLGLAAASLGWEARAELNRKHYERAVDLYLAQMQTGDKTAVMSLRLTVMAMLKEGKEALAAAAKHVPSQRVVTAYIVAGGGPRVSEPKAPEAPVVAAWLEAVEKSGVVDVAGADRLAWAAYQAGDFKTARRWAEKTEKDSAVGQWIVAKLLLREGKKEEAMAALAKASKLFPGNEEWNVSEVWEQRSDKLSPEKAAMGEMGVVLLSRKQYVEALDTLLRAGFWEDASYVAERVLTVEELVKYVDGAWADPGFKDEDWKGYDSQVWGAGDDARKRASAVRDVLARRLTRLGRYKDARSYFVAFKQPWLDRFVEALRTGYDEKKAVEERAAAMWKAAQIARHRGMELMGTEGPPDGAIFAGNHEAEVVRHAADKDGEDALFGATEDEIKRIAEHAPTPDKRFHYRYVAADLAWTASKLMPDESEETARVLCIAGSWLKNRDPKAADRFYKAMMRRCKQTALAQEGGRLKWFPNVADPPPMEPKGQLE